MLKVKCLQFVRMYTSEIYSICLIRITLYHVQILNNFTNIFHKFIEQPSYICLGNFNFPVDVRLAVTGKILPRY